MRGSFSRPAKRNRRAETGRRQCRRKGWRRVCDGIFGGRRTFRNAPRSRNGERPRHRDADAQPARARRSCAGRYLSGSIQAPAVRQSGRVVRASRPSSAARDRHAGGWATRFGVEMCPRTAPPSAARAQAARRDDHARATGAELSEPYVARDSPPALPIVSAPASGRRIPPPMSMACASRARCRRPPRARRPKLSGVATADGRMGGHSRRLCCSRPEASAAARGARCPSASLLEGNKRGPLARIRANIHSANISPVADGVDLRLQPTRKIDGRKDSIAGSDESLAPTGKI